MKNKKLKKALKITSITLLSLLVIVIILFACGVFNKKGPTIQEINTIFKDNRESFEIANEYLYNLEANEKGIVNYDLEKVEDNKTNMTEKEYQALKTVFSNSLVINYHRRVGNTSSYTEYGKFQIKSIDKEIDSYICKIPENEKKRNCIQIVDDWYIYDNYYN